MSDTEKPDLIQELQKIKQQDQVEIVKNIQNLRDEKQKQEENKIRIQSLNQDLNNNLQNLDTKESIIEELGKRGKKLSENSKIFIGQIKQLQDQIDQSKKQLNQIQIKYDSKTTQQQYNQKQLDQQQKTSGNIKQTLQQKDKKIEQLQTELENLKIKQKEDKLNDLQNSDEIQKQNDKLLTDNKKLERIKNEILTAIKKQFKLIDILKKQKQHLELVGSLNFNEDDLIQIFDIHEKMI